MITFDGYVVTENTINGKIYWSKWFKFFVPVTRLDADCVLTETDADNVLRNNEGSTFSKVKISIEE